MTNNAAVFNQTLASTKQIVFIDSQVEDYQFLAQGVLPGIEKVILDRDRNGIEQITEVLNQKGNFSLVHIVSHGSPGCLYLGNSQLSLDTIDRYRSNLRSWFASSFLISQASSLLLYGCNVGAQDVGEEFILKLFMLTHANISASSTPVGNAAKGGNWELDVFSPKISKELPFSETIVENYQSTFAQVVYEDNSSQSFGSSPSTFTRTFEVTQEGTLNNLSLGFNATHGYRGDIRVTLTAPDGTSVIAVASSSDNNDNYDILLEDGGGVLDDKSNDTDASQ